MIGNGLQILISNNGASQVTTIAVAVEVWKSLMLKKVIISNFWLVVYIFLLVRFLECLFSVSYIDFEVLWGRNRSRDALKAGVKASLFLCVNCIFKNAWMSADIGRSACRSCGIHGKSPWRVIPSDGCSFPACLPDDIISVWQQRGVKATAGPQVPQTRRFTITPPAHVWQAQSTRCLLTTALLWLCPIITAQSTRTEMSELHIWDLEWCNVKVGIQCVCKK